VGVGVAHQVALHGEVGAGALEQHLVAVPEGVPAEREVEANGFPGRDEHLDLKVLRIRRPRAGEGGADAGSADALDMLEAGEHEHDVVEAVPDLIHLVFE